MCMYLCIYTHEKRKGLATCIITQVDQKDIVFREARHGKMNTMLRYSHEEPRTPEVRTERRTLVETGSRGRKKKGRGMEEFDVCSVR